MTPSERESLREAIALLRECCETMTRAMPFVQASVKMHPDDRLMYADILFRLRDFVGA